MKNTFGQSICVTLFGESHGDMIGAVVDGLAPGIPVSEENIRHALSLRRPSGKLSTARHEADEFSIVSGVFRGTTTGTPLCLLIPNTSTRSADYEKAARKARPSHADYTANIKYHGYEDYRGGGHFSGRITAPLVAVGAIFKDALKAKGIDLGTHIARIGSIGDRPFGTYEKDFALLNTLTFPALDSECAEEMKALIEEASKDGDSVGGVLESAVTGVPAGVGEPWFDTVESLLSHMLFSVPAVKGVEFGEGFGFAALRGSEANDAFCSKNGTVKTVTNRNGGINGGITNGMPITFRTAIKPTPSIYKKQKTVSLETGEPCDITIEGRHDPCIVHRARAVVDAVTAIVIADMLAMRFGTDYLSLKNVN